MASKSAEHHPNPADILSPAMDYQQHEGTYQGFLSLLKWGIAASVVLIVALYCFIHADLPVLGGLLLLVLIFGLPIFAMMGRRR